MRSVGAMLLSALVLTQPSHAQVPQAPVAPGAAPAPATAPDAQATPVPKPAPVGTMSELMLKVIYPYSDAMFYIQRAAPKNDVEWNELQGKALALAEFGNVMMMQGRARDQKQWRREAAGRGRGGRVQAGESEGRRRRRGVERSARHLVFDCHIHRRLRPSSGAPYPQPLHRDRTTAISILWCRLRRPAPDPAKPGAACQYKALWALS